MSHSHPATRQDEWVLSRIPGPSTFVEVGAYDGLHHSNTFLLEKHGWKGTLIEGNPEYSKQCSNNRPKCVVRTRVIGGADCYEHFVYGGQYGGLVRTMPDEFLKEHRRRENRRDIRHVATLSDIIGTGNVGYLSVDTEGSEYEILECWLGEGGTADAITSEFRYSDKEFARQTILMDRFGYELDEIRGFDLCFLRRDQ